MMKVTAISFDEDGKIVNLKGTFEKSKFFSIITDKIIYWAELEIDYAGG